MDSAVVQQYMNFFQDFIDLCQSENWPQNETSEQEIRNAFVMCQHVEKSLSKLQKQGLINEFLTILHSHQDSLNSVVKNCILDPPKYVLKKIINSNTKIHQTDIAFKIFLELFSENVLEQCLTDIMIEVASKETLLSNLTSEVDNDKLLKLKSELFLSELCNHTSNNLDLVSNCNRYTAELVVFCLSNTDGTKYTKAVQLVKDTLLNILCRKDSIYRHFWKLIFDVSNKYFNEMCLGNPDIYKVIVEALLDCGKLLREDMTADSFYVNLSKSDLENIVKRICNNDCLKSQFFDIVDSYDTNKSFWQNML